MNDQAFVSFAASTLGSFLQTEEVLIRELEPIAYLMAAAVAAAVAARQE